MAKLEVHTNLIYTAEIPNEIMNAVQEENSPKDIAKFFCTYLDEILQKNYNNKTAQEYGETVCDSTTIYIDDKQVC